MDPDNFIAHVKANDIYKDVGEDVETRSDTSNDELEKPLPKWKKMQKVKIWWQWR